jgi:hypothetical protein
MPAPKGNKNASREGPQSVVVTVRLDKNNRSIMDDYLIKKGIEPTEENARIMAREMFWKKFSEETNEFSKQP